ARLGVHVRHYRELNEYLREYVQVAAHVEPDRTLLALTFTPNGPLVDGRPVSAHVGVLEHAGAYVATAGRLVYLNNYEARSGLFPLRFRRELDPYRHIGIRGGLGDTPPDVEFLTYGRRTGAEVDYVVVSGDAPATH